MFHEVQAEMTRRLEARRRLPVTREHLAEAWALLDETLDGLAARYHDDLGPRHRPVCGATRSRNCVST